jgi:hypothetical protein
MRYYIVNLTEIYYIKMKVCMSGCLPPDPHNLKFGVGSSFHPGWKPGQGATPNIEPRPRPLPLLLLNQSARDYFTIVLWNSPGQFWLTHACCLIEMLNTHVYYLKNNFFKNCYISALIRKHALSQAVNCNLKNFLNQT